MDRHELVRMAILRAVDIEDLRALALELHGNTEQIMTNGEKTVWAATLAMRLGQGTDLIKASEYATAVVVCLRHAAGKAEDADILAANTDALAPAYLAEMVRE